MNPITLRMLEEDIQENGFEEALLEGRCWSDIHDDKFQELLADFERARDFLWVYIKDEFELNITK